MRQLLSADDDACRVSGGVAVQTLQLQADVQELLVLRPAVGGLHELGVFLQRRVQVDLRPLGNELRDGIGLVVGDVKHSGDVADDRARLQGAEGDDLAHLVFPVFVRDVGDHLFAAAMAEVDVEVGHRNSLRVEEALEEEPVLQGVDVRDLEAVGDERPRARAAPGTHRDAILLGVVDEVPHDEEVAGEAHGGDDGKLELQALRGLFRHGIEPFREPRAGKLGEVRFRGVPRGHFVDGELRPKGRQIHFARLRDLHRVADGVGKLREYGGHFVA